MSVNFQLLTDFRDGTSRYLETGQKPHGFRPGSFPLYNIRPKRGMFQRTLRFLEQRCIALPYLSELMNKAASAPSRLVVGAF